MKRRRMSLSRMLLITASICAALVAISYLNESSASATIIHKYLGFFSSNYEKSEETKAEQQLTTSQEDSKEKQEEANKKQEEERKQAEAKKKAEEAARLVQWKQDTEAQIKSYFGSDISKVGIVYYDLERNQKIAINEENVFTAASTVKVQMNMIAYQWVKEGKLSLDEEIKYVKSKHWEAGTGKLQGENKSQPIKVQKLLDYSIIYSDNIATRMIMERLGSNKNVRAIANQMAGTNTETAQNKITAEEEFRLLKLLYENRNDKYYAYLIEVMKNTVFHDRIDKYIPQELVAHKIGDYATYVNDVGIVFTEKPYILVVYTNELPGLGEFQPHEKIAGLSKLIYEAHLKK